MADAETRERRTRKRFLFSARKKKIKPNNASVLALGPACLPACPRGRNSSSEQKEKRVNKPSSSHFSFPPARNPSVVHVGGNSPPKRQLRAPS